MYCIYLFTMKAHATNSSHDNVLDNVSVWMLRYSRYIHSRNLCLFTHRGVEVYYIIRCYECLVVDRRNKPCK